jgi:hypothetical protein
LCGKQSISGYKKGAIDAFTSRKYEVFGTNLALSIDMSLKLVNTTQERR